MVDRALSSNPPLVHLSSDTRGVSLTARTHVQGKNSTRSEPCVGIADAAADYNLMWSWERNLSDFLHIFRLDTIRRKITSFALLATLIPSLTMGVLSYTHSKEILAEKTAQELRNATAQVTQELNLWLRERRHESKVFSNSYEVTENLEKSLRGSQRSEAARRLRLYLKSVRARFPDYQELLVVDKKLKVIATSGAKASSIRLPGNWLELAKARKPIFGDPFLEEKGKNVAMMMGVPVQTSRGRILGMLVATVNFQTVEQHLKSSPLADKGTVYLVTRNGSVFIASRNLPNGFLVTQLPKETAGALFEKEGAPIQYTVFEEADVIFRRMVSSMENPFNSE